MPDTDQSRKTKKLIENIEAFQLLCKQMDIHAGELLQTIREELDGNGK